MTPFGNPVVPEEHRIRETFCITSCGMHSKCFVDWTLAQNVEKSINRPSFSVSVPKTTTISTDECFLVTFEILSTLLADAKTIFGWERFNA